MGVYRDLPAALGDRPHRLCLFRQHPLNTIEDNVFLGYRWLTLKYSHELGKYYNLADSSSSYYYEAALAIPLPSRFSPGLHAGHQVIAGAPNIRLNHTDYRFCLSRNFSHGYSASLNYTANNANKTLYIPNLMASM
ncbi:MAG: hypothetical protein KGQ58_00215 [Proteobacteria bacterium]|nr:hypothetical protein [Pseudomonadota bacterium]MDE3207919.1 hypothetical protein [Pseudomonadota bacterium]